MLSKYLVGVRSSPPSCWWHTVHSPYCADPAGCRHSYPQLGGSSEAARRFHILQYVSGFQLKAPVYFGSLWWIKYGLATYKRSIA